ncbi:4Fe-4S dicluster domain-containing protein [Candidatus Saganbacteria bacterium]|uniref:4Fe-4S dicluster domain-containing protein n=1 Tax=Candidatus Saganbacteria bacterium TaxID=2575572 RepID=A0A9D6UKD7_UNCSA|nr:4Fe-4S dicluster domain-containing protein [Candidatus Saganbacteria bacterium]
MKNYIIQKPDLEGWIEKLLKREEIVAPVKKENFTSFTPISSVKEIIWGAPQTVIPPKQYLYPQSEELLTYEFDADGPRPTAKNFAKERILFGVHPCDLNAIFQMDQVFAEKNRDENYLKKRKAAVLIGVDCLALCAPQAFCSRMGAIDPKGRFDLFLTDIGDSFFLEAATAKGKNLAEGIAPQASESDRQRLSDIRRQRDMLFEREQQKLLPGIKTLPALVKENHDHPAWEERGGKCYGCGSCNMVCPTCYCFDVQDYMQISLARGVRTRFWDGCMLEDFAKVASGENFRENRADRLRHRTYRKLYYLFEKWGEPFCTGCGRCPKACLTKIVSPLEIANEIYAGK